MAVSNEKCCFVDKKLLTKAVNFENQGGLVDFACGKQLPVGQITLNIIAIKELDKNIKIPVSSKNIGRLKEVANKSSASSVRHNLHVDASERYEWEISASEICDPTFEGLSLSSLISCFLRLPTKLMSVRAQLQKLMLHKHGGRSCKKIKNPGCCGVDGKFGTAVLQVPVEGGHQGGCFSVEYKGRNQAFENHASSGRNFYITTFFDCCEHFAEPVTQGYQLTLVFDLIWTNAKIRIPQDFPVFLTSLKQVKEVLKPCLIQVPEEGSLDSEDSELEDSDSEMMELSPQTHDFLYSETELKENILFFILHEKYDIENFAFEFLCSQDRKAAELLKSCGFLDVHLAMAKHLVDLRTIATSSKVEHNSIEISRWIDSDDVVRNLSIELKSNDQFVGRIEDRFSSSRTKLDQDKKMENRGGNTEFAAGKRNLHHGVLVIWPKHHSFQIYCRYGLQSLLIRMSKSLVSAPNWTKETGEKAKNELRQLISFCCAEPKKVWTLAGMENGELTLRLFRFCITLRAREEGIDLLKLVGSNFYKESRDIEKFEGIQTEEVAQTIAEFVCADFVRQVSDWDDVAELFKRIISSSRIIAKQLIPIVKLAKCFLDLNCEEGAKMIGDAVSSSFANTDLLKAFSKTKQSHVEAYMDMIVALEMNPETASSERIASFFILFSKLQLSMQCRFVLDFEARFCSPSKKHPSCQSILYGLCQKILSITCNIYAPSVKCFAVDLVCCFLRLGNAEWFETVISNICREPTLCESQTFILMKKDLIEKLITSPVIHQLATTSELGQSIMIPLICRSFLPLVEEKSTAMPRREVILEMVRWLLQAGDESQTHTLLQHVCVNEISGSWAHQEKHKLFRMLMSSSDIWANLNSGLKLMVLKTCSDLVLLGISEVKQLLNSIDDSNSTPLLVDCVQFFIDVEKHHFGDAENNRLITSRVMQQLMTKISTPQLMELVFNLGLTEEACIKQFPLCIDWYRNTCQLFFQQDFVLLVNSSGDGVKKIFDCLLGLNDELCWKNFQVQICQSFPSEESNLFVQFVVSSEAIQEAIVEAPLALNVFNRILDHWIEESSPKKKPPDVDWCMPQASFPSYPEVETFLRSSEESMIYSKFRGIKEARRFDKLLHKLGPTNGFSVRSSLGGVGKKAFCKIEKTNSDYEIALRTINARQAELMQVEKLRIDLQERFESISKTERQHPLQVPVDFSLAVLPTMPTSPITEILPIQNEMDIPNIKVENEVSEFPILPTESELPTSANASDIATEHIQEEKSEENHDDPLFTPPNEAPSSDSTSCGIPNAGHSVDFQDGHMDSVGDIHQKSSSESTHSSLVETNTSQTKSGIVCCGTLSEQMHEFDPVFERRAASNEIYLDNQSGQLSKPVVCDASSVGFMTPFSKLSDGSEDFPARMLPNPNDESSPFQLDVVDTNDGPVTEVCTPEKSASSMDPVTQVPPPCKASDDQKEELAVSVDSNLVRVKFDFVGMRSRRKSQVCESRIPLPAGVVESNTIPQQQQSKEMELIVPDSLSIETSIAEVDPDSTNDHVSALSSVDLPNALVSQTHQQSKSPEEQLSLLTRQEAHAEVPGIVENGDKDMCSVPSLNFAINSSEDIALNLNLRVAMQEEVLSSAASCAQHGSIVSSECARNVKQSPKPELCQAIWKGRIISTSMGIELNVQILDMSALTTVNELNIPDTLKVVGRIPGENVLNYVNQIRKLGTNEVFNFDFTPVSDSDQKEYFSFLHRMQQNKEFTVIEAFSMRVKNFYIAALYEDSSSDQLLNCNSTPDVLRGIVVLCNKKRTIRLLTPRLMLPSTIIKRLNLDSTSPKNALVKNSTVEREELNGTQLSSSPENETETGMEASTEEASFRSVSTNLFPALTLPSLFPDPTQPINRTVLRRTTQANTFKIQDRLRKFRIPIAQETKAQSTTSISRLLTPVIESKLPESHGSEPPQPNLSHSDGVTRPSRRRRYEEEQKLEIAKQKVAAKLTESKLPATNRIKSVVVKVPEVERGKEVHARIQKNPYRSVVTKKKERTMQTETRQGNAELSSRRSDDLFKEKDRKRKVGTSSIPKPTEENTGITTLVENEKTHQDQTIENTPHRSQVPNKDQRAILADNLDVGQNMFHRRASMTFLDSILPSPLIDTQNKDSLVDENDPQLHDNAEKLCAPKNQEINWSPGMFLWKTKKANDLILPSWTYPPVSKLSSSLTATSAEPLAKTRKTRWSPLEKNVPVAVQNQISVPVDGESRMQSAVTFGSLTSTTLKTIGFHDPTPVSKASTPVLNCTERLTRARSQRKLVAEEIISHDLLTITHLNSIKTPQQRKSESLKGATKSTDMTSLALVAEVLEPKSVQMLGDSTTPNVERRRKDDSISGITKPLSISSSSCLPLSSTTSSPAAHTFPVPNPNTAWSRRHSSNSTETASPPPRDRSFQCRECGRAFYDGSRLRTHLRVHSGELLFECGFCFKPFTSKYRLDRHQLIHSGTTRTRAFRCEECGQTFVAKDKLSRHQLIHSGSRAFRCEECGQTFVAKDKLSRHLVIHTGERLSCDQCDKTFTRRDKLSRHKLTVHC